METVDLNDVDIVDVKKCGVSFSTKKSEDNKYIVLKVKFDGECGRNVLNLNFEISEEAVQNWMKFVGKFKKYNNEDDIKCDCDNCKRENEGGEEIEFLLSPGTTLYYSPEYHRITVKVLSMSAAATFVFKHNFEEMFGYVLGEVLHELEGKK